MRQKTDLSFNLYLTQYRSSPYKSLLNAAPIRILPAMTEVPSYYRFEDLTHELGKHKEHWQELVGTGRPIAEVTRNELETTFAHVANEIRAVQNRFAEQFGKYTPMKELGLTDLLRYVHWHFTLMCLTNANIIVLPFSLFASEQVEKFIPSGFQVGQNFVIDHTNIFRLVKFMRTHIYHVLTSCFGNRTTRVLPSKRNKDGISSAAINSTFSFGDSYHFSTVGSSITSINPSSISGCSPCCPPGFFFRRRWQNTMSTTQTSLLTSTQPVSATVTAAQSISRKFDSM